MPPHITDEIKHFFQVYKNLEHKQTTGFEVHGRKKALEIIAESIELYKKTFE